MKDNLFPIFLVILAAIFCFFPCAWANNIVIQNVSLGRETVAGTTAGVIKLDISWDNSWRYSADIYDAAWVFVKFSTSNDGITWSSWRHATLKESTWGNPVTAVDFSSASGTLLESNVPYKSDGSTIDNVGVFIFRSGDAYGKGPLSTSGIKLYWDNVVDGIADINLTRVKLKVFALEMVHIPTGAFYVGTGNTGAATDDFNGFYTYGTGAPYQITSEGSIEVGQVNGDLYYNNAQADPVPFGNAYSGAGVSSGNRSGPVPAVFPKGYQAFYIMKYELTQGQYRDFLNTLTREQQIKRVQADISGTSLPYPFVMINTPTYGDGNSPANRNGIRATPPTDTTSPLTFYCDLNTSNPPDQSDDGEFIACNFVNWSDLAAYADWAGLRPMSEFEYEKACRGPANSVVNEFAWGTSSKTAPSGFALITSGKANEAASSNTANCNMAAFSISGPMRSGFAATNNSTRQQAGASYYGVMDLSGNLGERAISIGNYLSLDGSKHGDGELDTTTGEANVSSWPTNLADFPGIRGGSWGGPTANPTDYRFYGTVSARGYAAWGISARYGEVCSIRLVRSAQ